MIRIGILIYLCYWYNSTFNTNNNDDDKRIFNRFFISLIIILRVKLLHVTANYIFVFLCCLLKFQVASFFSIRSQMLYHNCLSCERDHNFYGYQLWIQKNLGTEWFIFRCDFVFWINIEQIITFNQTSICF